LDDKQWSSGPMHCISSWDLVEMFRKQPVSGVHQSSAIVTISSPRPIARSVGDAAARRTHHPEDHHDRSV
jgi:hypothetical protein